MATKKTDLRKTSKRNAQPVLKKTLVRAETKRSERQTLTNKETFKDLKIKIAALKRFASFSQLNPNAILEVSAAGHIKFSNKAAGATLKELNLKDNLRVFFPADIDEMLKMLKRSEKKQFRRLVHIKDRIFGEVIYLVPEFDAIHIYAHDITERKKMEEEIRQSELLLGKERDSISAILSTAGALVIVLDVKGRIILFNKIWDRWQMIPAVKHGRIHLINSDLVERPSPRIIEGLEEMAKFIHPERFKKALLN